MPAKRTKSAPKVHLKRAESLRDDGDLFAADRAAYQAVIGAAKELDFATVASALALLGEVRHAARDLALGNGELIHLEQWPEGAMTAMASPEESSAMSGLPETAGGKRGRRGSDGEQSELDVSGWVPRSAAYLLRPPLVGADGRNLRDFADRLGVPVFVVVREPTTRMNLWPVVMIGPAVVRVRIPPPANDEPTIDWLLFAHEQLGTEATRECETEERLGIRFELLMERIGTLHYDDGLFSAAIDTAKAHARELKREARIRRDKASAKVGGVCDEADLDDSVG